MRAADDSATLVLLETGLHQPSPGADVLINMAMDALPEEDLVSSAVAAMLATGPIPSTTERFAERILPTLLNRFASGRSSADEAVRWFGMQVVRDVAARLSQRALFTTPHDLVAEALPNLARAIKESVFFDPSKSASWIANLLERPLAQARGRSLELAMADLESILSIPPDRDDWLLLAAQVLSAVRRTGCPGGHRLVERTFPVLYRKLVNDELSPAESTILGAGGFGWDVAKPWRHWLLDQWLDRRWPPASFLRCLGNDETLFRRIAHRAGRKRHGGDFLRSLRGAARNDSNLAEFWTGPVNRVLADPEFIRD